MKNQLNKTLAVTVLVLLIASGLSQQCPLSSSTADLLQAGRYDLTNAHSSSSLARQHKYQFNLNFQVPSGRSLQVAACKSLII